MAYDEALAARVRDELGGRPDVQEKKMFGGIAFLLNGNMACAVSKESLMVRLAPADTDAALAEPGVRIVDMTGRPMRGWVLVDPQALQKPKDLRRWVGTGMQYASTLPPK